ncbi:hypothetical protein B0H13DRAFT_1853239 [Mycena leptocephala]|nr:hypothetical protein B0H13DRAFT_1853239 [Mycena leptocephala]
MVGGETLFGSNPDYQVFAFSKSAEQFPDAHLGCGYFGPKGHAVIAAEVTNQRHTVEESIFFRTVVKLVDLPRRWDSIGKEFITAEHFAIYILVPHIGASLISVDLDISLQDAVNVLIDSREYGRVNHPEQGEASIPTPPNDTTSQLPRHRKKNVNLKPVLNQKPTSKKNPKSEKKAKKAASAATSSETHQYQTRRRAKEPKEPFIF